MVVIIEKSMEYGQEALRNSFISLFNCLMAIKSGVGFAICFFVVIFSGSSDAQTISTVAGNGVLGYSDGVYPLESSLFEPLSVAFDQFGNYYIADYRNYIVREVSNGTITNVAGIPEIPGDSLNTCPANIAAMGGPTGIAVDRLGNIYIADYGNQVVRKVTAATGIMTIVAGIGSPGYAGDGYPATAAQLNLPSNLAVDNYGNLYISDNGNNVIRKVDTAGIISTYAGSSVLISSGYYTGVSGYTGDGGPPTAASFYSPKGLFVDGQGNLFVADEGNNVVRMIYQGVGGIIVTVAGIGGTGGYSGDGGPATAGMLNTPEDIAVDQQGNLFISEYGNDIVRRVSAQGILSTIAGNDTVGYTGDGGPATAAELNGPFGLALDAAGNLYIADKYNSVVRKISGAGAVSVPNVPARTNQIMLLPNPNKGVFMVRGTLKSTVDQQVALEITDMLGREVYSSNVLAVGGAINTQLDPGDIANGLYLLHLRSGADNEIFKFVVEK